MNKHKIRLNNTNSINSINTEEYIDVNLECTSKLLPYPNVIGEVDAYEVFENERNSCEKYRLIVTINPYCTNVLFNTLTEIIRNEGSNTNNEKEENCLEVITDKDNSVAKHTDGCYGLINPNRQQMIMNTEYSKDNIGFVYHPGYDFFTNHLLRNSTFKIVNRIEDEVTNKSMETGISDVIEENGVQTLKKQSNYETCKEFFNTIMDFMRYSDGTVVKYCKRENINSEPNTKLNKHLYIYDDILSIEEAINSNLSEDNGWFGFVNNSTVSSKERTNNTSLITNRKIWKDLDISRVLNNYENCEFIDMYPDRSLLSFNPKVNSFKKRLEYNWNIILTYPYRNDYCPDIVTANDKKTNGLKMMTVIKSLNNNNADLIMFRSYVKHGLKRGDTFSLYIKKEGEDFVKLSRNLKVTNVGNMSGNNDGNEDFYFYTTDMSLLTEIFNYSIDSTSGKWINTLGEILTTKAINEQISTSTLEYRIRRVVGNIESDYYLRVFKKLPNLKNKKENLTDEIVKDKDLFENYLYGDKLNASLNVTKEDGTIEPYMMDFNNEHYKLAFNRTIYNDSSSQITFTDTIDIEHLVDNLGRPLHEFYVTIIKNNKGYNKWYNVKYNKNTHRYEEDNFSEEDRISEDVEYSHCFGNISSGFEFSNNYSDRFYVNKDGKEYILYNKAGLGDTALINELGCFNAKPYETEITNKGGINKDEFYGDIVDYNANECVENILQPINHRFNTVQRELPDNDMFHIFEYQEIKYDDYDHTDTGIGMTTQKIRINDFTKCGDIDLMVWQRPEGYFYQAHYPITLKEFGSLNQNAHSDLKVREAKPVQKNGIFIEVTTTLNYGVVAGDIIYVCIDDEENYRKDKWFEFTVAYIEGKNKFYMQPYNMSWKDMKNKIKSSVGVDYNWITLSKVLVAPSANEDYTQLKLRRKNNNIPDYATRIDHNKFLWRDLYRPGELLDSDLTQYPFANNAFYINKEINFFLKRQDPYGYSGLYCSQAFPNDVAGNHKEEDNYVYKTEDDIVC